MLAHELVVGYIGVQGSDQVIAVAERVGDVWVALAPVGVSVAHPVHPVPAPSLPELWLGEQLLHQLFGGCLGILGGLLGIGFLLFRSGRQARDGEAKTAEDGEGVRFLVGSHFGFVHPSQQKFVHRMARPSFIFYLRRDRIHDWLETPPFLSSFADRFPRSGLRQLFGRGWLVSWVGSSHRNPLAEILQYLLVQSRSVLRHPQILELVPDRLQKEALLGFPGHDGGAFAPSLQQSVLEVQDQFRLRLARAVVALVAMLHQYRPNLRLEEIIPLVGSHGEGEEQEKLEKDNFFHAGFRYSLKKLFESKAITNSYYWFSFDFLTMVAGSRFQRGPSS